MVSLRRVQHRLISFACSHVNISGFIQLPDEQFREGRDGQ